MCGPCLACEEKTRPLTLGLFARGRDAPMDVTDFIMSVVAATCATRATRPRVEKATTFATPPCSRNVSAMDTFLPALPADWNVATSTSMGMVTSAEMEPPAGQGGGGEGMPSCQGGEALAHVTCGNVKVRCKLGTLRVPPHARQVTDATERARRHARTRERRDRLLPVRQLAVRRRAHGLLHHDDEQVPAGAGRVEERCENGAVARPP